MNMQRIAELRNELAEEGISWGELAEIESAYVVISGNDPSEMLAGDMLDIIADDFIERTHMELTSALKPLGLEWTVEGLMTRLHDVEAFSQNS